jgi:pentatricopeptide repeat protein
VYTRMWGRLQTYPKSAPDERLVLLAANLAVDAGRVQIAAKLIYQMQSQGVRLTLYSYAVLLKGFGRAKNIRAVTRTLDAMRQNNLSFDRVTFNSAIDAHVRCGDLDTARTIVDAPEYKSLRDARTFNILLKGFARRGDVDAAFQVRDEIIAAGLVPNEVTQNTLVDACVRVGDFAAAIDLASKLAPGPGSVQRFKPGRDNQLTIALSRVLSGLADSGNLREAIKLLGEMEKRGAPPNHITYCSLINACMRRKLVPKAHALFSSMQQSTGVAPTLEVYNAMIVGLCKVGDEFSVDSAVRILCKMRSSFAERTQHDRAMVHADSRYDDADGRLSNAEDDALTPQKRHGSVNSGDQATVNNIQPSDLTYNAIIDGLVRFNRACEAEDVVKWMREDGVPPTVVTYTTLIKGWSAERNFSEARRVFQAMSTDGILPDRLALNAFINACARSDELGIAEQVLATMETNEGASDLSPDVYSYAPLIATHVRRADLDSVWKLYSRARKNGMQMTQYVADMMVNAVVMLGPTRIRHGRQKEKQALADMTSVILNDVWDDIGEVGIARVWRRRLLAVFLNCSPLIREQVANAGGSGALRPASERIFESHGWNKIDSGWRVL